MDARAFDVKEIMSLTSKLKSLRVADLKGVLGLQWLSVQEKDQLNNNYRQEDMLNKFLLSQHPRLKVALQPQFL